MEKEEFLQAVEAVAPCSWLEETVELLDEAMGDSGSHGFGHLLRVFKNAERIRQGEAEEGKDVDREVLVAGALLHDLVDLPKDHPERHLASRRSAEAAVAHFEELGVFAPDRLEVLHHAISAHSFSAGIEAESFEAQILCDADRLDALGAVGIARVFYVSGELKRDVFHSGDPFANQRPLDELNFAVDHFSTKLLQLRDQFYTETGRRLAKRRHAYMEGFLEQLADELQ